MATFHITRAEAAKDFDGLMTKVSNGDEVVIAENAKAIVVMKPAKEHVRLLSESLRMARERGSKATLDGGFEADLNAIIESRCEPMIDPLNDPWA